MGIHIENQVKTDRSWPVYLFGLVFFLVGAGFLVMSIIPTLYDAWQMQSWHHTEGRLLHAELKISHSDDSTTYRAVGRYAYEVHGRRHTNDRVAINSGSDNVGDFQENLAGYLRHHYLNHYPVTIWYDPDDPGNSIINRDIRWGFLAFKMIFVLLFGGIGLAILIYSARREENNVLPGDRNEPWLQNPDWRGGVIRSGAKTGMYGIWGFAIIWNLISLPATVMAVPEVLTKKEYIGLLVLLFPVVGVGLLYWAIKLTLEWRRFGTTPLIMDPFPGAIGGDLGGSIQVNMPYDPANAYKVTLSCIHRYVSGSGKNRSTSESAEWQDEGYARVRPSSNGLELQFRFQVPDGLPASQKHSDDYYLWRLNVEADIPGVDLDRSFELPVYATGERSSRLKFDSREVRPAGVPKMTAESLLPITVNGGIKELYYPMLRKPGRSLGLILFGATFGGVGLFLWGEADSKGFMLYAMSSVFNLIGWGIVLGGIYSALNALRIRYDGRTVSAVRSILGMPISRSNHDYIDVLSVEKKRGSSGSSGNRHYVEYDVIAKMPGKAITLAEHLDSISKADIVAEYFQKEFNRAGSAPKFEL